jgi:flagellar biogenesis protein FliO
MQLQTQGKYHTGSETRPQETTPRDNAHYWGNFFSSFIALVIVAVGVIVFLKKRYGLGEVKNRSQQLKVEERVQLGPKSQLVVASYRGQRFLLSQAGDTVTLLTELKTQE